MSRLTDDRFSLSPLSWYGGKSLLQKWVRSYLPPCGKYVEVFGGSGAILFARQPAPIDVYNDIMPELANFFRVVQEPALSVQLVEQLRLTPYSRDEYHRCSELGRSENPVEWARRTFVLVRQSYSSIYDHTWGYSVHGSAGSFRSGIDLISAAARRLAGVRIENTRALDLIVAEDSGETLFYADPPYLASTRVSPKVYTNEMSVADHAQLLDQLCNIRGMVVLSGYPDSTLYAQKLSSWHQVHKEVPCYSSPTRSVGSQCKPRRTECLWLNPAAAERLRQQSQARKAALPQFALAA